MISNLIDSRHFEPIVPEAQGMDKPNLNQKHFPLLLGMRTLTSTFAESAVGSTFAKKMRTKTSYVSLYQRRGDRDELLGKRSLMNTSSSKQLTIANRRAQCFWYKPSCSDHFPESRKQRERRIEVKPVLEAKNTQKAHDLLEKDFSASVVRNATVLALRKNKLSAASSSNLRKTSSR